MRWLLNRIQKTAVDVVTDKATQKVAGVIVKNVGPQRALSKAGAGLIVVGLIVALLGWFFLSSWMSWLVVLGGAFMVGTGYALRGFNSFLLALAARFVKWAGTRGYQVARKYIENRRARRQPPQGGQSNP